MSFGPPPPTPGLKDEAWETIIPQSPPGVQKNVQVQISSAAPKKRPKKNAYPSPKLSEADMEEGSNSTRRGIPNRGPHQGAGFMVVRGWGGVPGGPRPHHSSVQRHHQREVCVDGSDPMGSTEYHRERDPRIIIQVNADQRM